MCDLAAFLVRPYLAKLELSFTPLEQKACQSLTSNRQPGSSSERLLFSAEALRRVRFLARLLIAFSGDVIIEAVHMKGETTAT